MYGWRWPWYGSGTRSTECGWKRLTERSTVSSGSMGSWYHYLLYGAPIERITDISKENGCTHYLSQYELKPPVVGVYHFNFDRRWKFCWYPNDVFSCTDKIAVWIINVSFLLLLDFNYTEMHNCICKTSVDKYTKNFLLLFYYQQKYCSHINVNVIK